MHVAVLVLVYSGHKIVEKFMHKSRFWPHKPESGIGSSCI